MPDEQEEFYFRGFQGPRYTQTPDEIFDELMQPGILGEAELRVLLYIVRRTFGWKKDNDAISLTQLSEGIVKRDGTRLDWGAGIGRAAASRAVKSLERKGIIAVERSQSEEKGFETTVYRLRVNNEIPYDREDTRLVSQRYQGSSPKILALESQTNQTLVSQTNLQETPVQETIKQDNVTQGKKDEDENSRTDEPPYPAWIAGVVADFSREMSDMANTASNVDKAVKMWWASRLSEAAFVELLQQAKRLTRKTQTGRASGNKMDRVFQVLQDLLREQGS